jgi:hypothetical protein
LYGLLEAIKKTETRKVHKQCNERLRYENSVIKACSKFDLGYAALGGLELNWICAHTTELECLFAKLLGVLKALKIPTFLIFFKFS